MLCSIYRSSKKDETYLYLLKKDDFSSVPEQLIKVFGDPCFCMQISLEKKKKLAREDIEVVKEHLKDQGYFLQLPPSPESLLNLLVK